MTKEEIVKETALFYNSKNRSFSAEDYVCCYTDANSNHCAVGRCMIAEKRPSINSGRNTDTLSKLLGEDDIDSILEEKYRGHEFEFWLNLQRLHDDEFHWTEDGINDKGKQFVLDNFGVKLG